MASLMEKVSTLISANLHYMVDQALKTNSMAVIDVYQSEGVIDRVHRWPRIISANSG